MDEQVVSSLLGQYRSDLRNVVGSSASAYGYTLTIWSTGMVLSHAYGPPSPPQVFSFFLGAVVGFAVVGILAFGGVSAEFGAESSRIRLWAASASSLWGWRWGRLGLPPRTSRACRVGRWGRLWLRAPISSW